MEGKGWTYGKYLLEFERGGGAVAARLRGGLRRIALLAEERAGAAFDARLSEIDIDIDALAMTELRVMAARQAGQPPGPVSSLLKLRVSELTQAVARLGLEVLGEQALIWEPQRPLFALQQASILSDAELPVTSTYLNSRAYSIFGGSMEVQHDIIAKSMLRL